MSTVEPIRKKSDIKKVKNILAKQSDRNLLLFTFGINSGLRISDILALNIGDVKDKNYIQIYEQKTGKYKKFPLNLMLRTMFKQYTKGKADTEPLFQSIFKNRLDRISAYKILKSACKSANLECKVGTHTLRKTFGYHHYKQFKDVAILQKIFNHSSQTVTLKYIGIEQDCIDVSYKHFCI